MDDCITEFDSTRSSAAPVRVRNISNKICAVGKTYIKAERYFPFRKAFYNCLTYLAKVPLLWAANSLIFFRILMLRLHKNTNFSYNWLDSFLDFFHRKETQDRATCGYNFQTVESAYCFDTVCVLMNMKWERELRFAPPSWHNNKHQVSVCCVAAFIVKYLEQRSCQLQFEIGWVHQLLLDIGVPALRLLELYDSMFKSRVSLMLISLCC